MLFIIAARASGSQGYVSAESLGLRRGLLAVVLLAVLNGCVGTGDATSPPVSEFVAVQVDGILLDEGLPVHGARVVARAYPYEDCGYGRSTNDASTVTGEGGIYSVTLTLEVARRQCLVFGASKHIRTPQFPGDTGITQAFSPWVLECAPPEPCRHSDLQVPVREKP